MLSGIRKKMLRVVFGTVVGLLLLAATVPASATTTCRWLDHNTVLFCESSGSSAGTFVAFYDTAVGYWVYI
jgi:uncharacterized membrane protein